MVGAGVVVAVVVALSVVVGAGVVVAVVVALSVVVEVVEATEYGIPGSNR